LFPLLTFGIGLYLPGALTLYFAASSAVAVIQQHMLLNRDVAEMEDIADEPTQPKTTKPAKKSVAAAPKQNSSTETTVRVIKADEAGAPPVRKAKKKKRRR
jgi:membrane protein insertase Oxa1/YidC/SpoIIIJ